MSIYQLCQASCNGDNALVKSIIANGEVDINMYNDHQGKTALRRSMSKNRPRFVMTPLHYAMLYNWPSVVKTLLSSAETRLDLTDKDGNTALYWACYNNSAACIRVFGRDARCTVEVVNQKNNHKHSPLMAAVYIGNLECVREMVKLEGVDFANADMNGFTLEAMIRALTGESAIKHKRLKILHFLKRNNYIHIEEDVATEPNECFPLANVTEKRIKKFPFFVATEPNECFPLANVTEKRINIRNEEVDRPKEIKRKREKICWFCHASPFTSQKLSRCAGCKKAWYSGEECQGEDWDRHGEWCRGKERKRQIQQSYMTFQS